MFSLFSLAWHHEEIILCELFQEIILLADESRVDVNVDPQLHMACQSDLMTYCSGVDSGQGQSKLNNVLLGPVVQSIVSLTSSLRGQLIKCFTTL